MAIDLVAPASEKVVDGDGGGSSPSDPYVQRVRVRPLTGADGSGTTTGAAQTLFGGATPANGFMVQNTSLSADMWINDTGAAAPGGSSIYLAPLSPPFITPRDYQPMGAVSLYCTEASQPFMARKW